MHIPTISHAVTTHQVKGGDPTTDNYVAHTLSSEGADASEDGTGRGTPLVVNTTGHQGDRVFQEHGVWPSLSAESANNGGGSGGLLQSAMQVRRLTPTECLRLQGFPDHWLDIEPPLSDSAKYRMTGNAVCVNVAHWIGRRIMEAEAS